MRFFRTLPVAAAATLAFAVVVPASCSSTEGVPSAVALDASIDEMFGTKAAALTADTIVGNGLHITLTDAGRLQVVDLASAEMSRSDTGIPRAAIGLSVGSTLCHASLDDTEAGTPGIQNGIVAGVAGAGTDALPYKLVLTGTCAAVPVAITITYRPPQAFADVVVQVSAPSSNAATIRVLTSIEPDFQSGTTPVTSVTNFSNNAIIASEGTTPRYAAIFNAGPVWDRTYLGAAADLPALVAGGARLASGTNTATDAMAIAAQWNLGVATSTTFVTFRIGASSAIETDSDGDTWPDVCEQNADATSRDTDGNGTNDEADTDDDGDGILTSVEALRGDTDGDGVLDVLDADDDGDGVPTLTEGGTADTDGDGILDCLDSDDDGDGIPTATERAGDLNGDAVTDASDLDVDGDGVSNDRDGDSDNDGIPDAVEGSSDTDGDGTKNFVDLDSDGDTIGDVYEAGFSLTAFTISDGRITNGLGANGVADGLETVADAAPLAVTFTVADTDGDTYANYLDRDSDNDGILDAAEGTGDQDGDSIPNRLDLDSDDDGIIDAIEAGHSQAVATTGRITCAGGVGIDGFCNALEGSDTFGAAANYTLLNSDGDTSPYLPDFLDTDSDNDGIFDATEADRGFTVGGTGHVSGTTDASGLRSTVAALSGTASSYAPAAGAAGAFAYRALDSDDDGLTDAAEGSGDTDLDGVPDARDLDSDNDGILDSVEGLTKSKLVDSDGDGVYDIDESGMPLTSLTIGSGAITSAVGANGVATAIQTGASYPAVYSGSYSYTLRNTDSDGFVDYLDTDDDNDGILTVTEGGTANTDGDGTLDYRDWDDDNDTIATVIENSGTADVDGDGVANYKDLDTDNDGIFDSVEGDTNAFSRSVANYRDVDSDGDGVYDINESGMSTAGLTIVNGAITAGGFGVNGVSNVIESTDGYTSVSYGASHTYTLRNTDGTDSVDYLDTDDDNDGVATLTEGGTANTDGDSLLNYLDPDDDNDGITTAIENAGTANVDGDSLANYLDLDSDNDGILDSVETAADTADSDGVGNYLDLDSDDDGIIDAIEAGHGQSFASTGRVACAGGFGTNGFCDALETGGDTYAATANYTLLNTDADTAPAVPDYLDTDSDNDGIFDATEADRGFTISGTGHVSGTTDANGLRSTVAALSGTASSYAPAAGAAGSYAYRASDSDGDGLTDSAEGSGDTDLDTVPDARDLDSDNDGILDSVEGLTKSKLVDSDGDGVYDIDESGMSLTSLTIASGAITAGGFGVNGLSNVIEASDAYPAAPSGTYAYTLRNTDGTDTVDYLDTDDDNDGILTATEGGTANADGDSLPNYRDSDDDNDGITTVVENAGTANVDGDAVANYLDLDSDNDGIFDSVEGSVNSRLVDSDSDGVYDISESGMPLTSLTIASGAITTAVGANGVATAIQTGSSFPAVYSGSYSYTLRNTDGTDTVDYLDEDDDNDSIPTLTETNADPDSDGLGNNRDLDSDNDGISDVTETVTHYLTLDSDGDSINDVDEAGFDTTLFTISGGRITGLAGSSTALATLVGANGMMNALENADVYPTVRNYTLATGLGGTAAYLLADSDGDGISDGTEGTADTDGDGIPNARDLDSDNDGIPDATETSAYYLTLDSDGDGVKDVYEAGLNTALFTINADGRITGLVATPSASLASLVGTNGLINALEDVDTYAGVIAYSIRNTDSTGFVDYLDTDDDDDGIATSIETSADPDSDGLGNYRDLDSDNDGISDVTETSAHYLTLDSDGDGVDDVDEAGFDTALFVISGGRITGLAGSSATLATLVGANGMMNALENADVYPTVRNYTLATGSGGTPAYLSTDADGDGIPDVTEGTGDADGDGIPNARDLDSDNDGIPDATETSAHYLTLDSDGDGINDVYEAGLNTALFTINADGRITGLARSSATLATIVGTNGLVS